jgi:hypothetical protein
LFEFLFWWSSFYFAIPLALFATLSAIGTIDLFQTRHGQDQCLDAARIAPVTAARERRVFQVAKEVKNDVQQLQQTDEDR